jgi:hypothetical protein
MLRPSPPNRSGDSPPRKPTAGVAGCCAFVGSGYDAAAPPKGVMNWCRKYHDKGVAKARQIMERNRA